MLVVFCKPMQAEDFGRMNKRRHAGFRGPFQGWEHQIWATKRWKVCRKGTLKCLFGLSQSLVWMDTFPKKCPIFRSEWAIRRFLSTMLCSQTKILDGRTNRLESIFEALFNDRSDVPEIDQNKFLVPADLVSVSSCTSFASGSSLAQKRRSTSSWKRASTDVCGHVCVVQWVQGWWRAPFTSSSRVKTTLANTLHCTKTTLPCRVGFDVRAFHHSSVSSIMVLSSISTQSKRPYIYTLRGA